jgi:hypothetical protein
MELIRTKRPRTLGCSALLRCHSFRLDLCPKGRAEAFPKGRAEAFPKGRAEAFPKEGRGSRRSSPEAVSTALGGEGRRSPPQAVSTALGEEVGSRERVKGVCASHLREGGLDFPANLGAFSAQRGSLHTCCVLRTGTCFQNSPSSLSHRPRKRASHQAVVSLGRKPQSSLRGDRGAAAWGVRPLARGGSFPLGIALWALAWGDLSCGSVDPVSGGLSGGVPPVPIPNTVVKAACADDTWGATPWENRSPPEYLN